MTVKDALRIDSAYESGSDVWGGGCRVDSRSVDGERRDRLNRMFTILADFLIDSEVWGPVDIPHNLSLVSS